MNCVPKGHPGLTGELLYVPAVLKDVLGRECGLPRVFSNFEELNVCNVIQQRGREKANKRTGGVERWTCADSKGDKIMVALAWELPPPHLCM